MEWWNLAGTVVDIDAERMKIKLWLRGFDKMEFVPILPEMPEWMLERAACFGTKIPRSMLRKGSFEGNANWGEFSIQPYSGMSEEELWDGLAEIMETSRR